MFDSFLFDESKRQPIVVQTKCPRTVTAATRHLTSDATVSQIVNDESIRMKSQNENFSAKIDNLFKPRKFQTNGPATLNITTFRFVEKVFADL